MNITIAYSPREGIYLYAVNTPSGSAHSWNTPSKGARNNLDDTRAELERKYPTATFTAMAGI